MNIPTPISALATSSRHLSFGILQRKIWTVVYIDGFRTSA